MDYKTYKELLGITDSYIMRILYLDMWTFFIRKKRIEETVTLTSYYYF